MTTEVIDLQSFETLSPFEIKDELIKLAKKDLAKDSVGLSERRPRQSQLDRHHSARGLLPARPVCDHREQAGDGACRRSRRNASGRRVSRAV